MKHIGDITKVNGALIEPVHCITFGSPCQNLSIAGNRKGLAGSESGLFTEAVRIIQEMRNATHGEFPYFAIWENVQGSFSSNSGNDFHTVLEDLAHIVQAEAVIPRPEKRWEHAGCILLDGGSIAYRLMDSQYWGIPQRRKRIALCLDLHGHHAPDIVFEWGGSPSESCGESSLVGAGNGLGENQPLPAVGTGVSGHSEPSIKPWKGIARSPETRSGADDRVADPYTLKIRGGCSGGGKGALVQTDKSATLSTLQDQTLFQPTYSLQGNGIGRSDTAGCCGKGFAEDVNYTLNTTDRHAVVYGVAYGIDPLSSNSMKSSNPHSGFHETDVAKTLDTSIPDPTKNQGGVAVCQVLSKESYQDVVGTLSPGQHAGSYNGQDAYNDLLIASQVGFTPSQFGQYAEGTGTLRASGGDLGGGSETIVCCECSFDGSGIRLPECGDDGRRHISIPDCQNGNRGG